MVRIISLGLGVQSTALYYLSSMGQFPRADYAVFADTGREGSGTYSYLEFLLRWQREHSGIPIIVAKQKDLYKDLLQSGPGVGMSIPAFTQNPDGSRGMLRRQCTHKYKVLVINDCIRDEVYKLPKGARRPPTSVWLGISTDEIERMAYPQEAWRLNTYPFLGYYTNSKGNMEALGWGQKMSRQDLVRWLVLRDLPVPPRSACIFCPYQSDASWAARKRDYPEDFRDAVAIDEAIRNSTAKGVLHPAYLHRSCRPLAEVVFDPAHTEESGECSGTCHL